MPPVHSSRTPPLSPPPPPAAFPPVVMNNDEKDPLQAIFSLSTPFYAQFWHCSMVERGQRTC